MSHQQQTDINTKILQMHNAGMPSRQIETAIGTIDHSTICRRLKQLTPRKTTEIYKSLRAEIFAEKQRKLLMQCNRVPSKEQLGLITAVGILYDKERLERNQSTSNVSSVHADIAALRGQK